MESHLKYYSDTGITTAINICNFPEDFKHRGDLVVKAYNYLVGYKKKIKYRIDLLKMGENLFRHFFYEKTYSDEIADTYFRQTGKLLVREVREAIDVKKIHKSVYTDRQNVHDSKINKSVITAVEKLYTIYKGKLELDKDPELSVLLKNGIILSTEKYLKNTGKVLEYITESSSQFGSGIVMRDIFLSIWFFIEEKQPQIREELYKRLTEELLEAKGQCATGHVSRMVNSIQGYTNDPELQITISNVEQYRNVVKKYLGEKLSETEDPEIVEGITSGSEKYINYIKKIVREKIHEWVETYSKDILLYVKEIVNSFIGFKIYPI